MKTLKLAIAVGGDGRPVVVEQAPGSLWAEVRARQLMGLDGNARQPGDLIPVVLYERTATSLDADTRTGRDSWADDSVTSSAGAAARWGPVGRISDRSCVGGPGSRSSRETERRTGRRSGGRRSRTRGG